MVMTAGTIDLNLLPNYESQSVPSYINRDNTPNSNNITNEEATLGRILFYDKRLSVNDEVSCASCHKQEFAFGDNVVQSVGVNGVTGRHSTRLVNTRFGEEQKFFWDERAGSLEIQTTMPIQDHIEMGYSGANGDPSINDLISELEGMADYQNLFTSIYGDATITEAKLQNALAQFVRSIQSFDSKYDVGRAQVGNNNANFPNFTAAENAGKDLFMSNANNNGAGCNSCHRAPEFDIDPNSNNNGVVGVAGDPSGLDVSNTRSPSLRDMVNPSGVLNGPFMHDGSLITLQDVIEHYDDIPNVGGNNNLDNRLNGGGGNLNLSNTEKDNLEAFLLTLTGSDIYTNTKWSDPFDANGDITILNGVVLPIEYNNFVAELDDENVLLSWETLTEIDNSGWDIERSDDGLSWTTLDFVDGEGQSSEELTYEYIDQSPTQGSNYYRLKQFDFDGRFAYSKVVAVDVSIKKVDLIVYPNPTSDMIQVESGYESLTIQLVDGTGRVLRNVIYQSGDLIDVNDLTEGIYYLNIYNDQNTHLDIKRFVKM